MAQVEKGDEILYKIYEELNGQKRKAVLAQLSSQYYTNIPHQTGRVAPPVISSLDMFHTKTELSQLMKDMLNVSKEENVLFEDDVDSKYHALNVDMSVVERDSVEWRNILSHIGQHYEHEDHVNMKPTGDGFNASNKNVPGINENGQEVESQIVNIFRLFKPDEQKAWNSKLGNHHMLFHASRFANWVGILSRGLLLPEAVTKLGVRRTDFGWLGAGNLSFFFFSLSSFPPPLTFRLFFF